MRCSSASFSYLYYAPPLISTVGSIVGVALSIFYNHDHFSIFFSITTLFSLSTTLLPGKYRALQEKVKDLGDLRKQVISLKKERKELERQLAIFAEQNIALHARITELGFLNNELAASIARLNKENERFSLENQKLQESVKKLTVDLERLEKVRQELQSTAQDYARHLADLGKLKTAFFHFHDLSQQRDAKAFEKASVWLRDALTRMREESEKALADHATQVAEFTQIKTSLLDTFQTITLAMKEEHRSMLVEDKNRYDRELRELRSEVEALSGHRTRLSAEIDGLEKTVLGLKKTEEMLARSVSQLEDRLKTLSEENRMFQESNRQLKEQIHRIERVASHVPV